MKRKATLSLCRDGHPPIPFEDAAGLAAAFDRYEDAASLMIVGPSPFFDARVSVPRDAAAQLRVMNQFSDRTDPVFHALAMARRGYPIVGAILADDRVEGTPGVDRFIKREMVFAWNPDAMPAAEALDEVPELEALFATHAASPPHEALASAHEERMRLSLAADARQVADTGFMEDVPAQALMTRDGWLVIGPRHGCRAVPLDPEAVLAAVARRRGWRADLAVAHLVAGVLYPTSIYPGPRATFPSPSMRALTPVEDALFALRAVEISRLSSVAPGSYWDNEEGEVSWGGRDRSPLNVQSFRDAERLIRLLPAGTMMPRPDIFGGAAVLGFEKDGTDLRLEFTGNEMIKVNWSGDGTYWSEDVAFGSQAIPPSLAERIPAEAA